MTDKASTEPRADRSAPTERRGKTVKITVAALVTVGLASAGVVVASAAAASGPGGSGTSSAPSKPSTPAKPSAPAKPADKTTPPSPRPHIDGTVRSVSGDVVTVKDPEGFTRTIDVTSDTTYTQNGRSTDEYVLTSGRFVHAEGTVDSNGTTLDATSIVVMAPGARLPGPGKAPTPPKGGKAPAAPKGGEAPTPPKGGKTPAAPNGGKAPTPPTGAKAPSTGSTAHGS